MNYEDLIVHPEGGKFLEIYRSATAIKTDSNQPKSALTHIYFALDTHEVSRFHRVLSDEVWNLYQGTGLILYQWDGRSPTVKTIELSAQRMHFCHIVPAGYWQAAVPLKDRVLTGCSVAPGFEYSDFEIIDPKSDAAKRLMSMDQSLSRLIHV